MRLHGRVFRKVTLPVVWLLTTVLVGFPLGVHAADIVLCIEADGQVAIENFVDASCGSTVATGDSKHSSHPLEVLQSNANTSHCDACIDIPIRTSSDNDCTSFRVDAAKYVDVELQPIAWLSVTPALKKIPFVTLADAPSSGNGWQLTSLETVVLLT